jgi:hypothetical protein
VAGLFLEPVVQTLDHFITQTPDHTDITMIGISGGGWTTHLVAAVDERVDLSIPVAESAPLYVRNRDARSRGDAEQTYAPIYDEDIDSVVATWLEIYARGGYGPGRRQVMVANEHDACCFAGDFAAIVSQSVKVELGRGSWTHHLDSSHSDHAISQSLRRDVLATLLVVGD